MKNKNNDFSLVLGWQVNSSLDPTYWLNEDASPGKHSFEDLVVVPSKKLGYHTAIIAQSGSGKSFFLGRLIEEIILNTKSNCLIFDPNADFRQIYKVTDDTLWKEAKYNLKDKEGKLPEEEKIEDFANEWTKKDITIRLGAFEEDEHYRKLKIWWPSVSSEFIAEDADIHLRNEMSNIHLYVQSLAILIQMASSKIEITDDYLKLAEVAAKKIVQQKPKEAYKTLIDTLNLKFALQKDKTTLEYLTDILRSSIGPDEIPLLWPLIPADNRQEQKLKFVRIIQDFAKKACRSLKYVTIEGLRLYFGIINSYKEAGIIETNAQAWASAKKKRKDRIEVIDLPSLGDNPIRQLVVNSILETEWVRAKWEWAEAFDEKPENDNRTPTFIIVDEAHNILPNDPTTRIQTILRDQFRTIVAEGRKYGLFLIIVSQRPDKVDNYVLSECENKIIMKISSGNVLTRTKKLFGLEDIPDKLLLKCLEFPISRGILYGQWTQGYPQIFYSAARRTVEGGRDLKKKYWASPFEE